MLGADAPSGDEWGVAETAARLDGLMRPDESVDVTYDAELKDPVDEDGDTLAYVITGAVPPRIWACGWSTRATRPRSTPKTAPFP